MEAQSTKVRSYALVVAYDGTDYHGWQFQNHNPTIAGTLQETFKRVFNKNIIIVGASRTDAGVHALGQVALFSTDLVITPAAMKRAWSNVLPPAIYIRSLKLADDRFHPQHNVEQKTYYYHFYVERPLPLGARYGWYYRYPISLEKLRDCLQVFVGTHDFRSFCTLDDEQKNTVRTIDAIDVVYVKQFKVYRIIVRGRSFLHYMIRRIVGACLEVAARHDLDRSFLEQELAKKDPRQVLPKAPACGLVLRRITYCS